MRSFRDLREYQEQIIDFCCERSRCNVFAGMGMGKTVSGLTVARRLRLVGDLKGPTLALAPLRVARGTWPDEPAEWSHLSDMVISPIVGSESERLAAMRRDAEVYTLNYENLPWVREVLGKKRWPFDMVIADESTRLKSFKLGGKGGVRARSLGAVAHASKRWINLTGTPTPKGLVDLWGQQWFVDGGEALGMTLTAFKERWFKKPVDGYGIEPMPHAFEEITSRIVQHCITVDAKDYFDLKEPVVSRVWVELRGRARKTYDDMERTLFAAIQDVDVEVFTAAAKRMKCQQIANGFGYLGNEDKSWREVHDEKLQALSGIIEEASGAPVMVAYWFKPDLEMLKRAFPFGKELRTKQDENDWNLGKTRLLFVHPQSAGHGLNLQHGGNILAFYSLTDNLELYQQVIERIGPTRQLQSGYDRNVFIYQILARDTVDEDILYSNEHKSNVQDAVRERMKRKRTAYLQ